MHPECPQVLIRSAARLLVFKMNILLINPPFEPEESVGESASVRFVLNITPPLGLA